MTTKANPIADRNFTTTRAAQWQFLRARHELAQAFYRGWQRQPQAWRPWLTTLGVGWLLAAGLMIGLARLLRTLEGTPFLAWEQPWMVQVIQGSPLSIVAALWLEWPCNTFTVLFMVALAVIIASYFEQPYAAMTISLGVGLMVCIVLLGWGVAKRARPDLVLDGVLAPGFHAFPSGHIAHGTVLYGLLAYYWIRATQQWLERLLAIVLTIAIIGMVGIGRILIGAHWPTDVLAALVVGGAWLSVLIVAEQRRLRVEQQSI